MNEIQKSHLLRTAKWQKFLGIVMMICVFFIVLAAIAVFAAGSAMGDAMGDNPFFAMFDMSGINFGLVFGIIYLLSAVLYFFFGLFLLCSAKGLKAWSISGDEADLTYGLKNNKNYFTLSGILTIISIAIVVITIVAVTVAVVNATASAL